MKLRGDLAVLSVLYVHGLDTAMVKAQLFTITLLGCAMRSVYS